MGNVLSKYNSKVDDEVHSNPLLPELQLPDQVFYNHDELPVPPEILVTDDSGPELQLPAEMWHIIYGYLDTQDLLNLRLVSKSWSYRILQYMDLKQIKIKFNSVFQVRKFYLMMRNPKRDPRIQFFKFALPLHKIPIEFTLNNFTELVGSYALEYDLNIHLPWTDPDNFDRHLYEEKELAAMKSFQKENLKINLKINKLLMGTPNLEVLRITVDVLSYCHEIFPTCKLPVLPQLKELSIMAKSDVGKYAPVERHAQVPFDTISNWLESTPSLKKFTNDFLMPTKDILPYLNILQRISEVNIALQLRMNPSIEILEKMSKIPINIKNLYIDAECNCPFQLEVGTNYFPSITSFLSSQSDNLAELSLRLHTSLQCQDCEYVELELPLLKKLEKINFLQLSCFIISPLLQLNLPQLKFVSFSPSATEENRGPDPAYGHFTMGRIVSSVFSTVCSLGIPNPIDHFPRYFEARGRDGWNSCLLPNLNSFYVDGNLEDIPSDGHKIKKLVLNMHYFTSDCGHFTDNSRLDHGIYRNDRERDSSRRPNKPQFLNLLKFRDLKELEIRWCTAKMIPALANLTHHRKGRKTFRHVKMTLYIHHEEFLKVKKEWIQLLTKKQECVKIIQFDHAW